MERQELSTLNSTADTPQPDRASVLSAREKWRIEQRFHRILAKGFDPLRHNFQKSNKGTQGMSSKKKQRSPSSCLGDSSFKLKKISAKTPNQQETMDSYTEGYNLLLHGVAGTGKTFISLSLALQDVMSGKYQKILIIRSAVPSRDMGFLPGTLKEKAAVYEAPYQAICSELFGRGDAYEILKQKGIIEFVTTSNIRGITIYGAVVIVDEIQNMNFGELDTVITRIGSSCKVILCGDLEQTDLNKPHDKSGLNEFLDIIDEIWDETKPELSFSCVEFTSADIVRSGLVKSYIIAKSKLGLNRFGSEGA